MHFPPTGNRLIAALASILLLGFMAVNFANYYVSGHSVREALINSELPLTSNNLYSEIQASLLRPIYISSLMANDTFLKDWMLEGEQDPDKVAKYLREIRDKYDVFSSFVVSNISRRYYHFDGVLKRVSPEVKKDAWFFSMESHPANYRVDLDTNEANENRLTIFVNHKLFDYDGAFIGVTGIGLDAIAVSRLIDRYRETYHRNIYFVDRNGLVKSHVDGSAIDRVNIRGKEGIATVAAELLSGDSGFLEYPLDGDRVLLTYRFVPELDWYLIVEQLESAALAPIRRALYFNIAVSIAITAVVLLLSGYTINAFQGRLEAMARTDKLTGLFNRQYFDAIYEHVLGVAGRGNRRLSLVVFDIDAFKAINDHNGHLAGDSVIRAVAEVARDRVRTSDVVSRWGGDEFIVLLPDCDEAGACAIAEAIRQGVKQKVMAPGLSAPVTLSAGVAEYRQGDSYESLIGRADQALYQAKRSGRDRTCTAGADVRAEQEGRRA